MPVGAGIAVPAGGDDLGVLAVEPVGRPSFFSSAMMNGPGRAMNVEPALGAQVDERAEVALRPAWRR